MAHEDILKRQYHQKFILNHRLFFIYEHNYWLTELDIYTLETFISKHIKYLRKSVNHYSLHYLVFTEYIFIV
jgi:hypothetical protein